MATLSPPRNSEDSIDGSSELTGVSSTIRFWEEQGKQPQENPDQQQRDGKHKEQPVGQDLQQREGEQKGQRHGQDLQQDKEEERKKLGKEKKGQTAGQKALRFLSMLLLVAMVPVVWCSVSDPPVLVWRFSFLLCCSAFLWSRRLDVTVSALLMFLVTLSGLMAALYLDVVLDREIGVVMAHLNSHLAVGMLGYALAKHCQHNGLEVNPATATPPKKLSEKLENRAIHTLILGLCYMSIITAVCFARMAWVVWYRAGYPVEYLGLLVFGPMSFALLMWSKFMGVVLLRSVFIGEGRLALLSGLLVWVPLLFLWSWMLFGDVGAMVVTWLGILVWTGWFGYALRVYNSFKHEPFLQPVHWLPPVLVPLIKSLESASKKLEFLQNIAQDVMDQLKPRGITLEGHLMNLLGRSKVIALHGVRHGVALALALAQPSSTRDLRKLTLRAADANNLPSTEDYLLPADAIAAFSSATSIINK